jgi:hypothetical protein
MSHPAPGSANSPASSSPQQPPYPPYPPFPPYPPTVVYPAGSCCGCSCHQSGAAQPPAGSPATAGAASQPFPLGGSLGLGSFLPATPGVSGGIGGAVGGVPGSGLSSGLGDVVGTILNPVQGASTIISGIGSLLGL